MKICFTLLGSRVRLLETTNEPWYRFWDWLKSPEEVFKLNSLDKLSKLLEIMLSIIFVFTFGIIIFTSTTFSKLIALQSRQRIVNFYINPRI